MATDGNAQMKLTGRQRRAIAALLSEPNVKAAAHAAKVGERTLHRWLDSDPNFLQALTAAESGAIDAVTRRLVGAGQDAADALTAIMRDPENSASVRRLAAVAILDQLIRLRELRDVEQRLSALEAAYGHTHGKAAA